MVVSERKVAVGIATALGGFATNPREDINVILAKRDSVILYQRGRAERGRAQRARAFLVSLFRGGTLPCPLG